MHARPSTARRGPSRSTADLIAVCTAVTRAAHTRRAACRPVRLRRAFLPAAPAHRRDRTRPAVGVDAIATASASSAAHSTRRPSPNPATRAPRPAMRRTARWPRHAGYATGKPWHGPGVYVPEPGRVAVEERAARPAIAVREARMRAQLRACMSHIHIGRNRCPETVPCRSRRNSGGQAALVTAMAKCSPARKNASAHLTAANVSAGVAAGKQGGLREARLEFGARYVANRCRCPRRSGAPAYRDNRP